MPKGTEHRAFVQPLSLLSMADIAEVGGKNASLGEMIGTLKKEGVAVPDGFALTVDAYHAFIDHNRLSERIDDLMALLKPDHSNLQEVAAEIQAEIGRGDLPSSVANDIREAYVKLCTESGIDRLAVAVRSSATAEDLPDASFAGQQATYLHVVGCDDLLRRVLHCFASLFNARAIAYRDEHGFGSEDIALSVGVQRMVRSDTGAAGVAFSIDTETGNPDLTLITGAWGLGEAVVQGAVDPDEFRVFAPLLPKGVSPIVQKTCGSKHIRMVPRVSEYGTAIVAEECSQEDARRFCLDDRAILKLADWVKRIADHYGRPMDVEWARDGETGELFIVQARPETVESRKSAGMLRRYSISGTGPALAEGVAIGAGAASGNACLLGTPDSQDAFGEGQVLVTEMTDPDWLPVMRKAFAIVTERGGRTSHAAIVSRELGIPAVTGAGGAMQAVSDGQLVTVSCCEGTNGHVYDGRANIQEEEIDLDSLPKTRTKVMLNLADPAHAQLWWRLPSDGVGLARMEFIVANHICAHPLALVDPDGIGDERARDRIHDLIAGYADGEAFFVDRLSQGIGAIAATVWPNPVIVRTSDFKTNEYADLLGGDQFEPKEENPMLGWRGVSRYLHQDYKDAFAMECKALRRVREEMGFTNVHVMLPFCRTPLQGEEVLTLMATYGLTRGWLPSGARRDHAMKVYAMCEVPSNVFQIDAYCRIFDGFSIGSNDLTQLILGVERDSERLADVFSEQDPAVRTAIEQVIERAHHNGCTVGLCGQGPSDDPDFARFLVGCGIDSVSVVPDSFATVKHTVAAIEATRGEAAHAAAE